MEETTQRALDEQCAQRLGYQTIWAESIFGLSLYLWDEGAIKTEFGASNCHVLGASWERLRVGGEVRELFVRLCPAFSARLEDAKILEDEIDLQGLIQAYTMALAKACGVELGYSTNPHIFSWRDLWRIARATPEQRARAFLEATQSRLSGSDTSRSGT